jgi:hypothetical protein
VNLVVTADGLLVAAVMSIVLTLIVCMTIYNITPASCFEELRPACAVVQGSVLVYDNECLAAVARACSGG